MKSNFAKYKKQFVVISIFIVLPILIIGAIALQKNTTINDSGASVDSGDVCPASTQPRFSLMINGQTTGLVGQGQSYSIDSIDQFDYQILQNESTSSYFTGKLILKFNGEAIITTTGTAVAKSLQEWEVGTYTLEGYKNGTLCGSGTIIIEQGSQPGDISDNTDENGNVTEGTQSVTTCQARFSIKLKNKETRESLTSNGEYQISRIEEVAWVVVNNMQTDPPLYHTKKVTLKSPNSDTVETFVGGEPRVIADYEEGRYVLKAYKGGVLCSKAVLVITEDTTASRCETLKPVAGFYRNSSGTSSFVKEGTFTTRSEFKYTAVVPNANGVVSDIPSTVDTDYFKGRIVMKVDGQVVDEYVRQRVKPTPLPQVNGNQYSLEVYDANTNELCSSSMISFGATPPVVVGGDVQCGELDIDQNEVADVHDLANFARKYNKSCTDDYSDYADTTCGPKDTDHDGKIDILDLSRFGQLYQQPSCSLNAI